MCGAPTSSLPRLTAVAPPKSCAVRANRSRWFGDGRRASWWKALPGSHATRRASPAKSRCRQVPCSGSSTWCWSGRMLAKAAGVSLRSVQRILEAHQLAPHHIRTFKLSNDPKFADKLKDIVGLYVDPPAHAVVLSVDEKSQIQALDRTQPGLPMKPGRAGTMTHDYKRHGTTTLFAALNVLDGTVIGHNM